MNSDKGLDEYLLDHYGDCIIAPACLCRTMAWLGRRCPNWKSANVRTLDELHAWQERYLKRPDKMSR